MEFLLAAAFVALPLVTAVPGLAQGRGGGPRIGKAGAPEDLTGYWVSVVTEDWRFRMVTPKKGDYASVPLTPEGRRVADTWDPAKDEAAGEQCKSYGAPALMRVPGRIHIEWQDDMTLKVETDAGTQTRLFHFARPAEVLTATGAPSYQGFSIATWEAPPAPLGGANTGGAAAQSSGPGSVVETPATGGSLKVVTTHLKPGYLRKNGVPYSANAVLTEYYTRTHETNGDSWLIITTIVDDPIYLAQPFLTSTNFKLEPNGAKFAPMPCTSR